jgi:hypothetical protein
MESQIGEKMQRALVSTGGAFSVLNQCFNPPMSCKVLAFGQ